MGDASLKSRLECSLKGREGDDPKTAIYTCAGCGARVRGFTGWRNHMKKAAKQKKFVERRENPVAASMPTSKERARPKPKATPTLPKMPKTNDAAVSEKKLKRPAPPPAPKPTEAGAGEDEDGDLAGGGEPKKRKRVRVRGPGNELRRQAFVARKLAAEKEAAAKGKS